MDKWQIVKALSDMGAALRRDTVLCLLTSCDAMSTQAVTDAQAIAFWHSDECESWKQAFKEISAKKERNTL